MARDVHYRLEAPASTPTADPDRESFFRAVDFAHEKHNAARGRLIEAVDGLSLTTLSRLRMVAFAAYIASMFLTYPAYAQFQELGNRLCESGLGQVLGVVFSAFAIYYLLKFVFKVMDAMDKHKSARSGEHEAGVQKLESAGSTLGAAFVPVFAVIFFELIGINTFSCLNFDIGLLG